MLGCLAGIDAGAASIRVAERLGEQLIGSTEVTGKSALVYRITREEWETLNRGAARTG